MRKLIYAINLTLDGCCDHTKGLADDELHAYFADLLRQADVLVYGRKTYELMVPYWPDVAKDQSGGSDAVNDFALAFDAVSRVVVFSRSLDTVEYEKATLFNAGLREEILKLKNEEGKDILLGGVDLPGQVMQLDLIDEYRIVINPLVAGAGRRLWDDVSIRESLKLNLVDTKPFKSGAVALHYAR